MVQTFNYQPMFFHRRGAESRRGFAEPSGFSALPQRSLRLCGELVVLTPIIK